MNYININRFRVRRLLDMFTGSYKDFYIIDNSIENISSNVSTAYTVVNDLYNLFRLLGIVKFQPFKTITKLSSRVVKPLRDNLTNVKNKVRTFTDKYERLTPVLQKQKQFQENLTLVAKMNDLLLSTLQDFDVSLKYYGVSSPDYVSNSVDVTAKYYLKMTDSDITIAVPKNAIDINYNDDVCPYLVELETPLEKSVVDDYKNEHNSISNCR